jgi:hypothetical protein
VDRYRVYRRAEKIKWWESTEDTWQRYDPAKIR